LECIDSAGKKYKHTDLNVKAYYDGLNYYDAIIFKEKIIYLKRIISGPVNLYKYQPSSVSGPHGGTILSEEYVLQKDGEKKVEIGIYDLFGVQKKVRKYFSDFPLVADKKANRDFSLRDIEHIVVLYNKLVIQKEKDLKNR
jgi:hypothetical protein